MKKIITGIALLITTACPAQDKAPATLKTILLSQLRSTHNNKDWFVPARTAIEGLTPEQARWKDSSGNHSIGQLTSHLIFWNLQQLQKFNGETPIAFGGDNNETFNSFTKENWNAAIQQLDSVLTAWEIAIEKADEKKLQAWYDIIAHISTHNAYHTGQIIYIRKMKGWWDPEKGVK